MSYHHNFKTCLLLCHQGNFENVNGEKAGLVWVLMYIFSFLFLSFFVTDCIRTGLHCSKSEAQSHYTLQGFDKDGFAHKTIHIFSIRHSMVFPNGGKVWKSGCCAIQLRAECEVLWWVHCLILLLWSRLTFEQLGIRIVLDRHHHSRYQIPTCYLPQFWHWSKSIVPTTLTTTSGFCSTPSATTCTGMEMFISPSYTPTPPYTATLHMLLHLLIPLHPPTPL